MNQGWQKVRLGDHVEIRAGFAFKSSGFTDDPDDIPLVKGSTVQQGYIDWDAAPRWPASQLDKYRRFELTAGDVVLAMDRPWVEAGLKYGWIRPEDPPSLLVQRVARLRGRDNLRNAYLRYVIGSRQFANYIRPIVTGVNVPHISGRQISDYCFRLPPLDVQDRIVCILAAFDNLLHKNARRITILEEMAEAIYREWFVNLRFPGHEQVKMVLSEVGEVPQTWVIKPIGEAVETLGGGTPSTKNEDYWEGGEVVWYTPSDLTASDSTYMMQSSRKITELGLQKSSAKMFPPYSVMMTSRATIGVRAINTTEACTNQGFITCIPNARVSAYQIYFWIADNLETITTVASGATFKEINKTTFRALPIAVPDHQVATRFEEAVGPIFKQIETLQRTNDALRETRDLLLPRLVTGEIDVSTLEPDSEAVVA